MASEIKKRSQKKEVNEPEVVNDDEVSSAHAHDLPLAPPLPSHVYDDSIAICVTGLQVITHMSVVCAID